VITFFLLTALSFPQPQRNVAEEVTPAPVAPEQVLAWQMEGLTQEEIREEVRTRGLTEYPEIAVLSALTAMGADEETIRAIRTTKAPRKIWSLDYDWPVQPIICTKSLARYSGMIPKRRQRQSRMRRKSSRAIQMFI
jgi:hypothetical protein